MLFERTCDLCMLTAHASDKGICRRVATAFGPTLIDIFSMLTTSSTPLAKLKYTELYEVWCGTL